MVEKRIFQPSPEKPVWILVRMEREGGDWKDWREKGFFGSCERCGRICCGLKRQNILY